MKVLLVHAPFDWKRPITTLPHLIRKVAGVYNNHGSFLIGDKIYESDISGIVEVPIKEWAKNQTITAYNNVDQIPESAEILARRMVKKHKYDFLSLFVWQPIYLATGWYIGPDRERAGKRFYCFEYLAYVLNIFNWYKITPGQFNQWCDSHLVKEHSNINIHDYIKLYHEKSI